MTGFMKGAMILTIAGLLVKVIGAISKVIVARILGGEGVGLYQMAYSLYQLIISIGAAGLPVAISIMVARKVGQDDIRGARHIFKVALITMGIIGSLLSLTFYGAIPYIIETGVITDSRAEGALVAVAPAIVIVSILACFRGYFQGFQNMLPTGISQVCEQLARVIVMVGAARLAKGFIDLGYHIMATGGTGRYFTEHGVNCTVVNKISEGNPNCADFIREGKVDLMLNTLTYGKKPEREGLQLRRLAVEMGVPCLTSLDTAREVLHVVASRATAGDAITVDAVQDYEME